MGQFENHGPRENETDVEYERRVFGMGVRPQGSPDVEIKLTGVNPGGGAELEITYVYPSGERVESEPFVTMLDLRMSDTLLIKMSGVASGSETV